MLTQFLLNIWISHTTTGYVRTGCSGCRRSTGVYESHQPALWHTSCHTIEASLLWSYPLFHSSSSSLLNRISFLSILSSPARVPHLSTVVGSIYHPPVLSIILLPHSPLFFMELQSFHLSSAHCQLQWYHITSASLPVRLSSRSVWLSASVRLLFCYQGW